MSNIYTVVTNNPDLIELQYKTFKKFLRDEYEYIVFNDSSDEITKKTIIERCKLLGVRCVNIPQSIHNCISSKEKFKCCWPQDLADFLKEKQHSFTPIFRKGECIQYIFDILGFQHNDLILLINSDVFLVKELNIRKYMTKVDLAANFGYLNNSEYPNHQLVFFNISNFSHKKTLMFKAGLLSYKFFDILWFMKFYINAHPEINIKKIDFLGISSLKNLSESKLKDIGFSKSQSNLIQRYKSSIKFGDKDSFGFFDKTFISYGLEASDKNIDKRNLLVNYIHKCLQ